METTTERILKKLAKANAALKKAEEARNELRDQALAAMNKEQLDTFQADYGTFSVTRRTNWTYTDKVKKLAEKVKLAQVDEQESGAATPSVIEFLTVRNS